MFLPGDEDIVAPQQLQVRQSCAIAPIGTFLHDPPSSEERLVH
ncbi:hypothetical protein RM530_14695 [Algiphilus sp. W345]|uniref:Uncharacterized protein n=1 Tax=Banduia mediterranea TaxID=3075609 RepID=A0ABU2WL51_9GAMM|nr:hypothetical protein [Algiphilus sp. W345]MDT0498596.1 hypothetical protein [Algiphilus sp. W345]